MRQLARPDEAGVLVGALGQQAQQIGLGYRVDDGSRVVNGTGAFGRGAITGGGLF